MLHKHTIGIVGTAQVGLLTRNASIFKEIAEQLDRHAPNASAPMGVGAADIEGQLAATALLAAFLGAIVTSNSAVVRLDFPCFQSYPRLYTCVEPPSLMVYIMRVSMIILFAVSLLLSSILSWPSWKTSPQMMRKELRWKEMLCYGLS